MNIKHISLLSLFCVVAVNAGPSIAKELEQAKRNLNKCHASQKEKGYCDSEKKTYEQAKDVFYRFNDKKALESKATYTQNRQETFITKKSYKENISLPRYQWLLHEGIKDSVTDYGFDDDYLGSNEPLENFFRAKLNSKHEDPEVSLAIEEAFEQAMQALQQPSE